MHDSGVEMGSQRRTHHLTNRDALTDIGLCEHDDGRKETIALTALLIG
jgi:hypothetical protein